MGKITIKSSYYIDEKPVMTTKLKQPLVRPFLLTALALSCLSLSPAQANIYKWVDEQGNVHYGQRPPSAGDSEKLKINHHAPQDRSSYTRPGQKKEDEAKTEDENTENGETEKKTEDKAEKPVESAADRKRRMAACQQAREQLARMQSIGRIRSRDKDGNTTFLSQAQKEGRMKKIRESIAQKCK